MEKAGECIAYMYNSVRVKNLSTFARDCMVSTRVMYHCIPTHTHMYRYGEDKKFINCGVCLHTSLISNCIAPYLPIGTFVLAENMHRMVCLEKWPSLLLIRKYGCLMRSYS